MTLPSAPAQPERPSLRARAKQLAPKIAERAEQVEQQRHVHDDTIQELIDSGLTRGLQSREWGGEEGTPEDFFGAVIEISKACPSTGWVLSILGAHTWEMAHMSKQLNSELFVEDPTTLLSSAYSPVKSVTEKVAGGYTLSGQWRSSSGIHHAKWVILGAEVTTEDGPFPHNMVVPIADVSVIDDWYTMGLCGTGSRSIEANEIFVPSHRVIDREVLLAKAGPGLEGHSSPLYQMPQGVLYTAIAGAPALGAGWGFYDEFLAQAGRYRLRADHTRRASNAVLTESPTTVQRIARAHGILAESERRTLGAQRTAYERTAAGDPLSPLEFTRAVYDVARCAESSVEVAGLLLPALTAGVVYRRNPLQRFYRDVLTARQHGTQNVELAAASMTNTELGRPAASLFLLSPERVEQARRRAERTTY